MNAEQHDRRLIAAAMFYFDQRDAGLDLRLGDVFELIPSELHEDLMHLIAAVNHGRAGYPPDNEPWSKPAEVIEQALRELRTRR